MAPIWNQEFLKTKHHYQRYKSVNNPSGLDDLSLRVLERDLSVQYKRRIKIGPDGFPKVYCAVDPASFERLCTETPLPAIAPPRIKKVTLEELIGTPASKTIPSIRIVFIDDDEPKVKTKEDLMTLFDHFDVPGAYLQENVHSVTHSCGVRYVPRTGVYQAWFHFLFKGVMVTSKTNNNGEPEYDTFTADASDDTWVRAGFVLLWTPATPSITLLCFGPAWNATLNSAIHRLERSMLNLLCSHERLMSILGDPYGIFLVVLESLYISVDLIVHRMGWVLSGIETKTFEHAHEHMSVGLTRSLTEPGQKQLDFVKLHNIAKHIYLLIEGMTAALETLKTMKEFHGKFVEMYRSDKENPVPVEEKVKVGNELLYVEGLFQSTKLKLGSMERRVANMINLGFHLVNQQESRSIQEDSTSMKIIATMTFIFLPITTVGTICGSQFLRYDVNDDGKEVFSVSRHFWIFWLSALTVTGASFGLWKVGYRSAFRKLRRRRVVEDVEVAADVIAKV